MINRTDLRFSAEAAVKRQGAATSVIEIEIKDYF
jgi:hypothetical protein